MAPVRSGPAEAGRRCTLPLRTVVVVARVTRAAQAAFGAAQVRRHADAVERGHEDVSAVSELWPDIFRPQGGARRRRRPRSPPHPPRAGSKPSRRDQSRRRRGLVATPDHENKCEHRLGFRGRRSYDRRGVAPSPALRPEAESGIREYATEMQRDQRVSRTLTSEGCAHEYATKGGLT